MDALKKRSDQADLHAALLLRFFMGWNKTHVPTQKKLSEQISTNKRFL
jgi:hypothetical protein